LGLQLRGTWHCNRNTTLEFTTPLNTPSEIVADAVLLTITDQPPPSQSNGYGTATILGSADAGSTCTLVYTLNGPGATTATLQAGQTCAFAAMTYTFTTGQADETLPDSLSITLAFTISGTQPSTDSGTQEATNGNGTQAYSCE